MGNKIKITGIYCIENIINGKKYIGRGVNIAARWRNHRKDLKLNRHGNDYFQKTYNKYGEENFKYWVIQECPKEILGLMEIYWIAYYNSYVHDGGGYNLTRGGEGMLGFILSEESRKKISESLKGENNFNYGKNFSEETRKKMSESAKGKNLGKHHSEETKQKLSNINKNPSEEKRRKMSDSRMGVQFKKLKKGGNNKYFGVTFEKRWKRWNAQINFKKEHFYLGSFKYEVEAALAFNEASEFFYGSKAKLNIIDSKLIEELWTLD